MGEHLQKQIKLSEPHPLSSAMYGSPSLYVCVHNLTNTVYDLQSMNIFSPNSVTARESSNIPIHWLFVIKREWKALTLFNFSEAVFRFRIRFWASRIRILPSSSKNIKKNLYFYGFVISLWHFSLKNDICTFKK